MQITINNHQYEANQGDRLLEVARLNHEHIGYFCGGNTICQTCYVKVLEGAELLSALSEEEKAILSENLLKAGTRMACQATVEKPGTIRVVSAVEEVKHLLETNPLELGSYAATMGWEAMIKVPDTLRLQAGREFDLWQLFCDVLAGIGDGWKLVFSAFSSSGCCKEMSETKVC